MLLLFRVNFHFTVVVVTNIIYLSTLSYECNCSSRIFFQLVMFTFGLVFLVFLCVENGFSVAYQLMVIDGLTCDLCRLWCISIGV
jgi:hypothetical protein